MSSAIPEPVTKLSEAFSRLPGVGPKTASRSDLFSPAGAGGLFAEPGGRLDRPKSAYPLLQRLLQHNGR